jgi:hypothetical protein
VYGGNRNERGASSRETLLTSTYSNSSFFIGQDREIVSESVAIATPYLSYNEVVPESKIMPNNINTSNSDHISLPCLIMGRGENDASRYSLVPFQGSDLGRTSARGSSVDVNVNNVNGLGIGSSSNRSTDHSFSGRRTVNNSANNSLDKRNPSFNQLRKTVNSATSSFSVESRRSTILRLKDTLRPEDVSDDVKDKILSLENIIP